MSRRMIPSIGFLDPGLRWLIHLRWLALVGQVVLLSLASFFLHIVLPLEIIIPCLVVTAGSNLWVLRRRKEGREGVSEASLSGVLIALDTLTLSIMLFWLGGQHNPFTALYLLHITIAAVILSPRWTWALVALCGVGYGSVSRHQV